MREKEEGDGRPLDSSNVGFKLLKKAGWSEGQGLGKLGSDIKSPVRALANSGRRGLGRAKPSERAAKASEKDAGATNKRKAAGVVAEETPSKAARSVREERERRIGVDLRRQFSEGEVAAEGRSFPTPQ